MPTPDFAALRRTMIASQIKPNMVPDARIHEALDAIPREAFVPEGRQSLAYIDEDLELAPGRFLMEPRVFARLLQAVLVQPGERVLLVGAGTGYGAAVLSRLGGSVVALEEDAALAVQAQGLLATLAPGVVVASGPLNQGWAAGAPYDVILFDGAVEVVPDAILAQLADQGRAAVVLAGPSPGLGKATLYTRTPDLGRRQLFDAAVRPLPGFARPASFVF
ncbi:protein-L-isoaspartate O-methyltransferase family protein [Zavarzinia sp. CC-PAN008]|uniref:protein-L-isoaspartate O-methyltransferase family protein n=1 Tax=Zavarzinia sp. CC-PAN008 TaxID=3243332 RepID=UPI003F74802D